MSQCKRTAIMTTLCKLANIYNVNLNSYQKCSGLALHTAGLSKAGVSRCSKLYDSVSYNTLQSLLDSFAKESDNLMQNSANDTIIHAGDNLDIRTSSRFEGGGVSYHELHLYYSMIYKSRIDVDHLSRTIPAMDLDSTDYTQFLLSSAEENGLIQLMVQHVLSSWRLFVSEHITVKDSPPKYPQEMASKTQKVSIMNVEQLINFSRKRVIGAAVLALHYQHLARSGASTAGGERDAITATRTGGFILND